MLKRLKVSAFTILQGGVTKIPIILENIYNEEFQEDIIFLVGQYTWTARN